MTDPANSRRRWFRFSLRSLFVLLTVFGMCLGYEVSQIRQRAQAVAMVEGFGGYVDYDYRHRFDNTRHYNPDAMPPGPKFLRWALGENYRANVVEVQLFSGTPSQRGPRTPEEFTDDDAKRLGCLTELQWLVIIDTKITDAGLEYFKDLKKLERLDLEGTRVTEAGVRELHQALPKTQIFFDAGYFGP